MDVLLRMSPMNRACLESNLESNHDVLFASGITPCWAAISAFFWLFFATAYTKPAKNPTPTADTDPNVTGSPKKIIPDAATGSLFNAPTMLPHDVKQGNTRSGGGHEPVCSGACCSDTPGSGI